MLVFFTPDNEFLFFKYHLPDGIVDIRDHAIHRSSNFLQFTLQHVINNVLRFFSCVLIIFKNHLQNKLINIITAANLKLFKRTGFCRQFFITTWIKVSQQIVFNLYHMMSNRININKIKQL